MADTLTRMVLVILGINLMFFLGQAAVLNTNPEAGTFYNCQGGMLGQFEATGCTTPGSYVLNSSQAINQLPSGQSTIDADTGFQFTDIFTGIKNWLLESLGLGYLLNLLTAPYNFLAALGLPAEFTFGIGSLWYALSFIVIVAWLFRG